MPPDFDPIQILYFPALPPRQIQSCWKKWCGYPRLAQDIGKVAEGAGKRYEGFRGGPFEVNSRTPKGRLGKG